MSIKTFITKYPARIAAWAIILVVIWTNFEIKFWKSPQRIIAWDVMSYYAYLPATIIYKDLAFGYADEKKETTGEVIFPDVGPKGFYITRTTYGLALLYSPFFLVTHAFMTLTDGEATGYSPPYKIGLIASSVFFLALGIYYLKRFLLKYFSQWVTAITLVAIVLGTNLIYYASYEAAMPHTYNFALIAAFIYYTTIWYAKSDLKNTLIIGFLLGLITLIRPVNLLVLMFFVLWGINSRESFRQRIIFLFRSYKWLILAGLTAFCLWIPQFLYWKFISGNYLYDTYSDMGFFFSNPQIFNSLFSYRKGLFLYIPLMAFAYIGIPFLFRKNPGLILAVGVFAAVNVYVLSSWCFWWFGGSYGPRSYIDTYAILAIPFAALTSNLLRREWVIRIIFLILIGMLIKFNFFQIRQYYHNAINWSGMTKEAYRDSFLRRFPSGKLNSLLRFPNRDSAIKGVYYKGDLTYDEVIGSPKKDDLENKADSITVENEQ